MFYFFLFVFIWRRTLRRNYRRNFRTLSRTRRTFRLSTFENCVLFPRRAARYRWARPSSTTSRPRPLKRIEKSHQLLLAPKPTSMQSYSETARERHREVVPGWRRTNTYTSSPPARRREDSRRGCRLRVDFQARYLYVIM